jgi:beta-glucosidase
MRANGQHHVAVKALVFLGAVLAVAACGDDSSSGGPIKFGAVGSLTQDSGKGSFRFGAATAATQIEDMNPTTDWYLWTKPVAQGGLGKGTFVDDAVRGYSLVDGDLGLVSDMHLDSYRFSIEWARIEPVKDQIDEAAIAHYRAQLETMKAMGIKPLVTVFHWTVPVWVADPRDLNCANGPTATNLCGFGSPGGPMIAEQAAEHAKLLGERFGDLVDEWGTVNEPMSAVLSGYLIGIFPPGKSTLANINDFIPAMRDMIAMHAAIYHALKAADTVDADGDGVAADVGFSMSVADWQPARLNKPSTDPVDIAAVEKVKLILHYAFVDAARDGVFDSNLDGTSDEDHPEWANTIDWLGLQYYFRAGVTGDRPVLGPPANFTPCIGGFDFGSCLPATDTTFCAPQMGYEARANGFEQVIVDHSQRYPNLPLVVTETGIASSVGTRRAETVVRVLEAIAAAQKRGADVRGYYHWSLTDNFEWAEGYRPKFGLYSVDRGSPDYTRTATEGATVLGDIASAHALTADQRAKYGGDGPMTPDPEFTDEFCTKVTN